MHKKALFAGSFDPFTTGHQAIVEQALGLFDEVVVAIGHNSEKRGLLPVPERERLIRDVYRGQSRVKVCAYEGLTGDFCRQNGIGILVRGIRNGSDFEFEHNLEIINRTLYPEITTVFLCTPQQYAAVSSSIIREILGFGGDVSGFLPQGIDIDKYLKHI